MLIVKDFKKLEEHGFKKLQTYSNANIWELVLEDDDHENEISLLVNPYKTLSHKDEMFVYAFSADSEEMDMVANIDIVFEMIADGTIEYVKGE